MSPTVPRLKRRAQFLKVARSGRRWAVPGLVLQALDRGDEADSAEIRAGFTVSRKVGNAVMRNRARRRLKAVAEKVLPNSGSAGYDYVLIGRGGTLDRAFPALIDDLQGALAKIADGRTQGRGYGQNKRVPQNKHKSGTSVKTRTIGTRKADKG